MSDFTPTTMSCELPEWECELLNHLGCTMLLVAEIATVRPGSFGPPAARGVHPTVRRQEARDDKRRNEWIKAATKEAAKRGNRPATRTRYERPAPMVTGEQATAAIRETRVEQSMSVRNPSRPTQGIACRTMRVWEIAREIDRTSAETVQLLRQHGEYVRNAQSTVVWPTARDFFATQIGA